jgi:hypothetical protein
VRPIPTVPYVQKYEGIENKAGWSLKGDYTVFPSQDSKHKLEIKMVLKVPEPL